MRYRGIEIGAREQQPGLWQWFFMPHTSVDATVRSEAVYATRERAVEACIREIEDRLERGRPYDRSTL